MIDSEGLGDYEISDLAPGETIPEPPEHVLADICSPQHAHAPGLRGVWERVTDALRPGATSDWGQPSASYGLTNIVKVSGRGITIWMHRDVAAIFGVLILDLDNHLRSKGKSLAREADDWGYAHRKISGSNTWSNHAWGLAADFNALRNPMGSRLITEFTPGWVDSLLRTKYRGLIRWGGRYTTSKDAMHFEFMGTRTQARALTGTLRAQPNPVPAHAHSRPTLRPGMMDNAYVRDVQGHLNYAFRAYADVAPLKIDGDFGDRTEIRLREWCKRTGIRVSSVVDETCWYRLHLVTKGARFTEQDKPF